MTRKGYGSELKCKHENEKIYGVGNCIKVAIGGSSDFIIAHKGRLIKFIEVKETVKKVYYPSKRERLQFQQLVNLGKHHNIPVELWIYFKRGRGKPSIKHVRYIYEKKKTEEAGRGDFAGLKRAGTPVNKQRKNDKAYALSTQRQQKSKKAFGPSNPQVVRERKVF